MSKLFHHWFLLAAASAAAGAALVLTLGVALSASPGGPGLPPVKAALERIAASQRRAGTAATKPGDPGRAVALQTDQPELVGMLGALDAPVPRAEFSPVNAWAGWAGGAYVRVWGGVSGTDPARGLLLVIRAEAIGGVVAHGGSRQTVLPDSTAGGPLRILGATGARLTVANTVGRTFAFDASADRLELLPAPAR